MFQTPKYRCCDKASRTGVLILPKGFDIEAEAIKRVAIPKIEGSASRDVTLGSTCRWEDVHDVQSAG